MTNITISAPYYGYEAWLPWSRWYDATLTEFKQAAIEQLTADVVPPSLANHWVTPTLHLRIPGREIPEMALRVREVISPGDLVLLLTEREIQTMESGTVPSERPIAPTTLALLRAITRRHDNLLADPRDIHVEEMEEDEEIAMTGTDQVANVIQTLDMISRMMTRRRVDTALPVATEVKKVLNMETFNRVCPVIPTSDESCSVCLGSLTPPDEEKRKMPNCVHVFHTNCLCQWLTKNAITCPVCREPAVTDKKDYGYLGYGTNPDVYVSALSTEADTPEEPEAPPWMPVFPYTGGMIARRRG